MLEKRYAPRNTLLLGLELAELQSICAELQRADLVPFERLLGINAPPAGIWFPESGFISVLVRDHNGSETEVGMVGREGAIGQINGGPLGGLAGHFVAQHRGVAHYIAAERIASVVERVPRLVNVMQKAQTEFLHQVASTAHANARGQTWQRLARWLLMAHDRIDSDVIFVTHGILASMLGVRRVGVTNAMHVLEGEKLIRAYRGRIRILDRAGLIEVANNLYVPTPHELPETPDRAELSRSS